MNDLMSLMNQKSLSWAAFAAGMFATGMMNTSANAQTADALISKLVDKGILTSQEASELKKETQAEADKNFTKSFKAKTGMPDWITNYKLSGDFRGRFQEQNADNEAWQARDRYRFRLRAGLTLTMLEHIDVGFRFATGNPQTNPGGTLVGGQTISANQDLNSLESRKFLWLDTAFARWTPIKTERWNVSATIGKMDNPFLLSNMLYDYDVNPEGASLQVAYNINAQHSLRGIGALFVLDELNQSKPPGTLTETNPPAAFRTGHDPYFYGGQVLLESKWSPELDTSIGAAMFNIVNKDSLSAQLQPFYNSGNSRDANGFLKYNFDPIIGSASATVRPFTLGIYPGPFPIKVGGEYLYNPGAPSNNKAYRAGITLGKAGKKRTWELSYRYQRLEADAWFDAMVDDDNGAFFGTGNPQMAGTGKANGWFGGTNVKGHQAIGIYSFTDFANLTFTYYNNKLIINAPGQKSNASHFMADLNFKF